jgi:hypothetical protein
VVNTDPAPAPGSTQPVGGFSALLDAGERNTFWAMPDNGFGSKANSRSFLLRVYLVRADFETRRGGSGDVEILDWITLRDPDGKVPWAVVNENTPQRLLTGGDLDLESMRVDRNGDLWFGEEFGPFLVHTDATGKVLEAPIPLPGVSSPDYPADAPGAPGAGNLRRSNGFEGMAISRDGRTLYPILEGAVAGDDPRVRRLYSFDIDARRYEPGYARYEVADPAFLVSDLTRLDDRRFIALERDNFEGAAARHKKAFVIDPRVRTAGEVLVKREVVDLLAVRDPNGISLPGRPGDMGLGDPFSMPYVTIESVLPLGGNRVAFVNDTNFGSRGRNPELPDPSDFIVVRVPGLAGFRQDRHVLARPHGAREASSFAVLGDTPYGDEQRLQFPALVADVDADPDVEAVLHLGDIKSGGTTCSDERFADLRALFDTFDDPFVLTPGDNDWTDCHRASNGAYVPTERLDRLREVFFPEPGRALGGGKLELVSQAQEAGRASSWRTACGRIRARCSPWSTSSGPTTGSRPGSAPRRPRSNGRCASPRWSGAPRRRSPGSTARSTGPRTRTRAGWCWPCRPPPSCRAPTGRASRRSWTASPTARAASAGPSCSCRATRTRTSPTGRSRTCRTSSAWSWKARRRRSGCGFGWTRGRTTSSRGSAGCCRRGRACRRGL